VPEYLQAVDYPTIIEGDVYVSLDYVVAGETDFD
jgi:hypothetical protein